MSRGSFVVGRLNEIDPCQLSNTSSLRSLYEAKPPADRSGISLEGFNWTSLAPDRDMLDEQIARLTLPAVKSPPLVPDA
jgi:hypothetical protein